MARFESLLNEVEERFQLGEKTDALLAVLLDFIRQNGLTNFLGKFSRVGLGDVAESWVSRGANTPLSHQQIEDALGEETLNKLANQVGLPANAATSALAFMVPAAVDELTPDGILTNTPVYFSDADDATRAAHAASDRVAAVPAATLTADSGGNSALRWLLPLLVVGLLIAVAVWLMIRPNRNLQMASPNTNANRTVNTVPTNANTVAKKNDSRVSLRAENGKYLVSGVVSSEAERNQISEAVRRQFGEANVDVSGLRVDASARTVNWLARFEQLLPDLKGWASGELTFEGENSLRAAGSIPQTVIDRIKVLFTGWTLPAIFLGTGAEAQAAANQQAAQALETASTPQQVVDALNLSIINFATGKSDVPADAQTILQKAAAVLKNAPAETKIEIGGHTDNQGDKAKNQKLSDDRANAVRSELIKLGVRTEMLTAKGYGQEKPKADNSTEQGRFQNRRIEYALISGTSEKTAVNSNTAVTNTNSANAGR